MSAKTPLSAGTRLAIWLSSGAALPVVLTVGYDLAVSGLLTLRSGYTFGWAVVTLSVLLVVGVVRLLATRHQRPLPRELWVLRY